MSATTPILDGLIASGDIRVVDGTELVGIAADGVEVAIGNTFRPELAERYLSDFPTPEKW